MIRRNDLTAEYVRSILRYDPATGQLFRILKRSEKEIKTKRPDGRRVVRINGFTYKSARIIWLIMVGEWPALDVDHKDIDPSNDRWDNLRLADQNQNMQNRKKHRDNHSGFKGVSFNRALQKWHAQIGYDGTQHHLGYFVTAEEAHVAYSKASRSRHGQFSRAA